MTLVNPKPPGWITGDLFTETEVNTFGEQMPNAIDGVDGGTYTPTTALLLGGMFSPIALSEYNAIAYGATGLGVADDTAAIATAVAAAAAGGGGVVVFPAGTYRTTSALAWTAGVSFRGAGSGVSIITMDHASNSMFTLSTAGRRFMTGLSLQHSQANSGNILAVSGASAITHVNISNCSIGSGDSNGHLVTIAGSPTAHRIAFHNCRFLVSGATNRAISCTDATSTVVLSDNEIIMNESTYSGELVFSHGHLQLTGNTFDFSAHTSGTLIAVANNGATGSIAMSGNRMYFGTAPGGTEYGVDWVATAKANIAGNAWHPTQGTHRLYEGTGLLGTGSRIEDLDFVTATTAGTTYTVPDGFRMATLESTNAGPPTITMPARLFPGQRLTVAVYNGGAGTWGGPYVFSGLEVPSNVYFTAIANLVNGQLAIHEFVVMDHDNDGTYGWHYMSP